MSTPFSTAHRKSPIGNSSAFSLIEMMITVALLGFIVVGLTAMFVQTQRAFRGGMAQTDVLEAGRAVTDLLARELAETSPAYLNGVTNFYAQIDTFSVNSLSGSSQARTNVLDEFFFLTRNNQTWTGNGFVVAVAGANLGAVNVGTLYHYQDTAPVSSPVAVSNLVQNFQAVAQNAVAGNISTNLHRVADGIVHLRVQTYSCTTNYYTFNGALITPNLPDGSYNTNNQQNTISVQLHDPFGQILSTFTSNAVPAYVELELGVLERQILEKFNALPAAVQQAYLARPQTAGAIHVFRRRIAIPNVDPAAYR